MDEPTGKLHVERSIRLDTIIQVAILLAGLAFTTITLYVRMEDGIETSRKVEQKVDKMQEDIIEIKIQQAKIDGRMESLQGYFAKAAEDETEDPPAQLIRRKRR